MKDELNCSHNGGGVVYLLQSVAIHFNLTVGLSGIRAIESTTVIKSEIRRHACMLDFLSLCSAIKCL